MMRSRFAQLFIVTEYYLEKHKCKKEDGFSHYTVESLSTDCARRGSLWSQHSSSWLM